MGRRGRQLSVRARAKEAEPEDTAAATVVIVNEVIQRSARAGCPRIQPKDKHSIVAGVRGDGLGSTSSSRINVRLWQW